MNTSASSSNGAPARVADLQDELDRAMSPEAIYELIVAYGTTKAGAVAASVALIDPSAEWVEIAAHRGYDDAVLDRFGRMPADADVPLAEAIRAERTIIEHIAKVLAHYDGVQEADVADDRAYIACIPIRARGHVIGAVGFSFGKNVAQDDIDMALLQSVTQACGDAIDRASSFHPDDRYQSMLEAARSRLAFVSAATRALAKSLDRDAVLQTLTRLVVPRFADWASILLREGDELVAATLVHKDLPVDDLSERAGRFRTSLDVDTPSTRAYLEGHPILAQGVDDDLRARITAYPELADHLAATRDRLVVPIIFQDRILGVLTLGESTRSTFDEDDMAVAYELASRAGTALYNAERYAAERDMAEVLQRAVLPAELPKIEGLTLAARYLPATVTARVGGDWYDAFELRDGRIGLCVGDVVGHGVDAAACMGQLRNALRVYAIDGAPTGEVVSALNRFTIDTEVTNFTTLVYGAIDTATGELEWTSAGHPPLVFIRQDGTVAHETRHGTPIGIMGQEYGSETTILKPGETAVVYTDGLIERRVETLADGLNRLRTALDALRDYPVEEFVERVVNEVAPAERPDDICALAIHRL